MWTPTDRRLFYETLAILARRHSGSSEVCGTDLTPFELSLCSQSGEDGVLAEILHRLGPGSREFVEFGAETGIEGNCVALADVFGWSGLFIEADEGKAAQLAAKYRGLPRVRTLCERITAGSVDAVFAANGVSAELDVLSIDVDGNDLWIWRALTHTQPRVVVIEYNASLGFEQALVQPYDADWVWSGTDWFGASLAALEHVAGEKGYVLVHTELAGVNAFFVRVDLAAPFAALGVPRRAANYAGSGRGHPPHPGGGRYLDLRPGSADGGVADGSLMDPAEAFRTLRADPRYAQLMCDTYVTGDPRADAERFRASAEFAEVEQLLRVRGKTLVDLGAGTGIASYALAMAGATTVYAVEPDASEAGRAAIADVCEGLPVRIVDAFAEELPLADGSADAVYARQVLHHARDLDGMLRECARVLRAGGMFLASREHVVDDAEQLRAFLEAHPVHRLAGNEHAYALDRYLEALQLAGLQVTRVLGPWDSIINAFPVARSTEELARMRRQVAHDALVAKFGPAVGSLTGLWGVTGLVWRRLPEERWAGRPYAFLARKP